MKHYGFCRVCWGIVDVMSDCCCAGCGCDGEVYWSEWHNDPPRCCDPCDGYGNWTGPGNGPYRAPYGHAYAPQGHSGGAVYASAESEPAQYAQNHVNRSSHTTSNMKTGSPRQHNAARQQQPPRAKTQVARSRGAAAIVIRR